MPDMEKVIKGLELLKDFLCDGLPGKRVVFNSYIGIANDAIAMLKEQKSTLNRLRSTMEDMVRGNASEEVSYLLRLLDKWE